MYVLIEKTQIVQLHSDIYGVEDLAPGQELC